MLSAAQDIGAGGGKLLTLTLLPRLWPGAPTQTPAPAVNIGGLSLSPVSLSGNQTFYLSSSAEHLEFKSDLKWDGIT